MVERLAGDVRRENRIRLDPGGFSDPFTEIGRERTLCLLSVYEQWGLDAVNLSARDLAMGIADFRQRTAELKLSFISANLLDEETREPLFPTHVIKAVRGQRFAIVGFSRQAHKVWHLADGSSARFYPPEEVLADLITPLKKENDAVILLANYPMRKLGALLQQLPTDDYVIGGDSYSATRELTTMNGALISYAGKEGQRLNLIRINQAGAQAFESRRLLLDLPEDRATAALVGKCDPAAEGHQQSY